MTRTVSPGVLGSQASSVFGARLLIQGIVLSSASSPGPVLTHAGIDELFPDVRVVAVTGDSALQGGGQGLGGVVMEVVAGGTSSSQCLGSDIDDRVDQSARGMDDGNCPVAKAVELVEPARFVTAGHDEDVGAGFDAVRLSFIEGERHVEAIGMGLHQLAEASFDGGVARAEDDPLEVGRSQLLFQQGKGDLPSLLRGQATDESDEGTSWFDSQPAGLLEGGFAGCFTLWPRVGVVSLR